MFNLVLAVHGVDSVGGVSCAGGVGGVGGVGGLVVVLWLILFWQCQFAVDLIHCLLALTGWAFLYALLYCFAFVVQILFCYLPPSHPSKDLLFGAATRKKQTTAAVTIAIATIVATATTATIATIATIGTAAIAAI